ncbi:opalin [Notamacropus eugenii]|uniref:opalin n=1 Tax=Notamacropus eugenii TaxID=9315 RepID=UPI003B67BE20
MVAVLTVVIIFPDIDEVIVATKDRDLSFQVILKVSTLLQRKLLNLEACQLEMVPPRFSVYDPLFSKEAAAAGCSFIQAWIDLTLAAESLIQNLTLPPNTTSFPDATGGITEDCITILRLAAGIPTLVAMVLLVALIVVCARKRRKDGHTQENQRPNDFPDIYDSSEISLENLSSPDMDVKETIEMEETHVYVKTITGIEEISYDAYVPRTEMKKKQNLPRWLLPKRDRK